MSSNPAPSYVADSAVAQIPTCALDEAGIREQRARYARIASCVTRVEQALGALLIDFNQDLDRQVLEQALAVERECCPFFQFELDAPPRRLRVTVAESEQLPALDAIRQALGATHRVTPKE